MAHIEAGERSFDWAMPEELNRVIIDHISDYLFATGEKARVNLMREAVNGQIVISGNPIVDACYQNRILARRRRTVERFSVPDNGYVLVTLHREENTDNPDRLIMALDAIGSLGRELQLPVLMLAHPCTLNRIEFGQLTDKLKGIRVNEAVGYLDFLDLLASAALICTDSGGVQQEACIMRIHAITLRCNTEWTETLEIGANRLVGVDRGLALESARQMIKYARDWDQPFGHGCSAARIIDLVETKI